MAKTNAAEAKKSRKALGTPTTTMQGVDAARRLLGVPLTQDLHAVRDTREKVLEVAIGHEVRVFHKAEVAINDRSSSWLPISSKTLRKPAVSNP